MSVARGLINHGATACCQVPRSQALSVTFSGCVGHIKLADKFISVCVMTSFKYSVRVTTSSNSRTEKWLRCDPPIPYDDPPLCDWLNDEASSITWHAIEANDQVRLEVLRAGIGAVERRVRDADAARSPAGADAVHVHDDVGEASDVSVVAQNAASELHATVQRATDDNRRRHGTGRPERLRFAVLGLRWKHTRR